LFLLVKGVDVTVAEVEPQEEIFQIYMHPSETGVTFDDELSLEAWVQAGTYLGHMTRWSPFAIGDWFIVGEERFEPEWAQFVSEDSFDSVVGVSGKTCRNYAAVCRQLPHKRRRADLEFGHHSEIVSKIKDPKEQDEWLKTTLKNHWTQSQLRRALNGDPEEETVYAQAIRRLEKAVIYGRENLSGSELGAFNKKLSALAFNKEKIQ
jgi:hypothetical protein